MYARWLRWWWAQAHDGRQGRNGSAAGTSAGGTWTEGRRGGHRRLWARAHELLGRATSVEETPRSSTTEQPYQSGVELCGGAARVSSGTAATALRAAAQRRDRGAAVWRVRSRAVGKGRLWRTGAMARRCGTRHWRRGRSGARVRPWRAAAVVGRGSGSCAGRQHGELRAREAACRTRPGKWTATAGRGRRRRGAWKGVALRSSCTSADRWPGSGAAGAAVTRRGRIRGHDWACLARPRVR